MVFSNPIQRFRYGPMLSGDYIRDKISCLSLESRRSEHKTLQASCQYKRYAQNPAMQTYFHIFVPNSARFFLIIKDSIYKLHLKKLMPISICDPASNLPSSTFRWERYGQICSVSIISALAQTDTRWLAGMANAFTHQWWDANKVSHLWSEQSLARYLINWILQSPKKPTWIRPYAKNQRLTK